VSLILESWILGAFFVSTVFFWWYWKPTSKLNNALRWGQALVGPVVIIKISEYGLTKEALIGAAAGGLPVILVASVVGFFSFKKGNKTKIKSPINLKKLDVSIDDYDDIPASIYKKALDEFESERDEGLYAKSIALSGGDEAKAKAHYIQSRSVELHNKELEQRLLANKKDKKRPVNTTKAGDFLVWVFLTLIFSALVFIFVFDHLPK